MKLHHTLSMANEERNGYGHDSAARNSQWLEAEEDADDDEDEVHQRFVINTPPKNSIVIEINYYDNPWFPQELEDERRFRYMRSDLFPALERSDEITGVFPLGLIRLILGGLLEL